MSLPASGSVRPERADAPPLDSRLLELGLLLRRSQIDNRAKRQVLVGKHPGRDAGCRSRQLLIEEAAHQQVAAPAADSLRIVDAEIAGLSQQIVDLQRKGLFDLGPPRDRR